MIAYPKNKTISKRNIHGRGLVNNLINSLAIELHIPGYQFCGPGTKLEKRLQIGDIGINPLDAACRVHDVANAQRSDINKRHQADKALIEKAWARVKAKNSSLGEKANAYLVANAMKVYGTKIVKTAVKAATIILKTEKPQDINNAIKTARRAIKKSFRFKIPHVIAPRIIHIPKVGGFLPLISILTALGAIGALASGGVAITRSVNSTKAAKRQLEPNARSVEDIAMGQGLYLKSYKKG